MSRLDLLVGRTWGQRVVVVGTLLLYAVLAATRPDVARASAASGVSTVAHLFTLIVAALLLASAIGTLLPEDRLQSSLGESAGPGQAALAGLVAGLLPGGPYAIYPIIESVGEGGADTPVVLTMLLGYGLVGVGRVPFGLVFFSSRIVALRLVVAGLATVAVGVGFFTLGAVAAGRSGTAR